VRVVPVYGIVIAVAVPDVPAPVLATAVKPTGTNVTRGFTKAAFVAVVHVIENEVRLDTALYVAVPGTKAEGVEVPVRAIRAPPAVVL